MRSAPVDPDRSDRVTISSPQTTRMDKTIQKPPFHRETLGVLKSLRRNLRFHDGLLIADHQDIQYPTAAEMAYLCQ